MSSINDAAAYQALIDNKFAPDLDAASAQQLAHLEKHPVANARDLRSLLWSSIDNASSKDLDQIEYAESLPDGGIALSIGIADVDSLIRKDSPLDKHAMINATSVYTGSHVYPMLPPEISTGETSLNEGEERDVIVIKLTIDKTGSVTTHEVFSAIASNHAKLAYETVGAWLEGRGAIPAKIQSTPDLESQLWLQDRAASLLKQTRIVAGALEFETVEATPVEKDGDITALTAIKKNRARDLIEDFMIAANVAIARFLAESNRSAIRRVVREPKRWNRIVEIAATYNVTLPAVPDSKALSEFLAARRAADPMRFADLSLSIVKLLGPGEYVVDKPGPADDVGHFGLAAEDYLHATAPNRRYADLVTQRLVKAVTAKAPEPYTDDELQTIAEHCTERENAANKVERTTRKTAAAILLSHSIGQVFDAIVTGVKPEGTYVRLLSPPAEGRVMENEKGLDVGERIRVKLLRTNVAKGFVDFSAV